MTHVVSVEIIVTFKSGPVCGQTFPEGDAPVSPAGQDPGVRHPLGFGAHAHIRIQTKAQQEAAQQGGVVLAVPLQTISVSFD